ncbi:chloramphenicol phosphotransferase CPT [Kribbella jiaozuonensis]|uniref:Chloramphenicol phosphotransferase CPT n=1 Tax=Kribbella jiaozuonensis TaxID=2575441 RepID=A0A4U3LN41_9ACTN|nr:chloramphenicol phosphotransferase CPT [Kribbella jiaozuonensis]TKK76524.1 chloramphenicol phosphotransferase CPT [Kribbella jiaozuonensis]
MTARLIILNGGSSSGKTALVRALQEVLDDPWLGFSVDDFVDALPAKLDGSPDGIVIGSDGEVSVGPAFRELEAGWTAGIVAMCRAGGRVLMDDVFLGGPSSQQRWRNAIGDLETLWVGVHCDPAIAAQREAGRGDRPTGMAEGQALIVHEGITYDVEVDTSHATSIECARTIADYLKA